MFGSKVPEQEEAWQLLMRLKDVVELAMSPTHTDESIGYFDSLIAEHRSRFKSVFMQEKVIQKHHFVEHYLQLIKAFGPLVSLRRMRFEAKHHFFKKIVRKFTLTVIKMTSIPIDIVNKDIRKCMFQEFPAETVVHLALKAEYLDAFYSAGKMLAYGPTTSFPDFAEIVQIIVLQDS